MNRLATTLNAKGISLLVFAGLLFFSQKKIRSFELPFPHFDQLITEHSGFQDAAFVASGFRGLAADVAWIQLLHNMGDYGKAEETTQAYPYLKQDTLRVTRIDPYYHGAYLFGAATLAYLQTTNRPAEALEILQEGIHYNPEYWPFQKFVTGIGYKQANQFEKMVEMLEDSVRHAECPTMVKAILANAYKLHKRYAEAIVLWETILADKNGREYHDRARQEISRLQKLLGENQ
jgi:tetratricopeptide (TPR) repeat protein